MTPYAELVQRARRVARPENDERARRWLGAVTSILADWGGPQAAAVLKESLPAECFSGAGTSGRGWAAAEKEAGGDPRVALMQEAEHRTHQPDPRNVAMMTLPLLGLVKEEVAAARGPQGVEALIAALPAPLQGEVRAATTTAPWTFRLIPQSYARPKGGSHH